MDVEASAQRPHALPNAEETELRGYLSAREPRSSTSSSQMKADALIADLDPDLILALGHLDGGFIGPSMFGGVDQEFPDGLKQQHALIFGQREPMILKNDHRDSLPMLLFHVLREP